MNQTATFSLFSFFFLKVLIALGEYFGEMIALIGGGAYQRESARREGKRRESVCHAIVSYFIIRYIVAEKLRGVLR